MRFHLLSMLGRLIAVLLLLSVAVPAGLHAANAASGGVVAAGRTAAPMGTLTLRGNAPAALHGAQVAATVTVSPTTVVAGETVAISGTHFRSNEPLEVLLATTAGALPLARTHADKTGAFTIAKVTIPASVPAGNYKILVLGLRGFQRVLTKLAVSAPTAAITVDPTTFAPGDTVKVSGTKFGPNESVALSLNTTSGSASLPLGQAKTDASGAFGPLSIHVPFGVPAGQLQVSATGQTSNRQATLGVTVHTATPTLTVSPNNAKPGATVDITGTHFQPGETVSVDLVALSTSAHVGTAQVDQSGGFTLKGATIPANTPEGTVSMVATGASSKLSATAQIKIGALPATLTLTPGTAKPGDTIKIDGKGFIPGETVTIALSGGKLSAITLVSVIAGTDGSFSIDKLTVPAIVPAGSYTLSASGQTSGRAATSSLSIQAPPPAAPIFTIIDGTHVAGQPYQLSPGGLVQVAGSNFPGGATVTVTLVSKSITITLGNVTANGSGIIAPTGLTVPANTPTGPYTLQAMVSGKAVASIDAQVMQRTPHLAITPPTVAPDQTATIQGSGFAPGEQVVLALNGAALVTKPATIMADTNGNISGTFVVPATVLNGANTITASGAASRATISVTLQANLPFANRWYFADGSTGNGVQTAIAMLNTSNAPATVKMTFLYGAAPERHSTQVVPANSELTVDLSILAGANRRVSTILESDRRISAQSLISYPGGDLSSAVGASGPSRLWYLAEGYTNGSFSEYLTVMNPNTTYATIDVRFLPFNNLPAREVRFVMQPRANIRIDAGQYMPKQSISAIVTSDKPVVVERAMRFGLNGRGAHDKIGITSSSTVWFFAEGQAAPDRQTFFTILNPNQAAPAAVTATFFDKTGKPVGAKTIIVNPLRRGNIKLNDVLTTAEVATVLTSNVPVVVERPLYQGPANLGLAPSGSVVFGRNGGGLSWAFPYGSTANGDQTTMYLFNPGLKPVTVHAAFYTSTGASASQDLTLAPNSGTALNANSVSGLGSAAFGAVLSSANGQLFIAEESVLNTAANRAYSTEGVAQ